eukprot:1639529-Rhodomonas_salina.2
MSGTKTVYGAGHRSTQLRWWDVRSPICYASAMRCPVLTQLSAYARAMRQPYLLRACYAVSGTHTAISIRACYASVCALATSDSDLARGWPVRDQKVWLQAVKCVGGEESVHDCPANKKYLAPPSCLGTRTCQNLKDESAALSFVFET